MVATQVQAAKKLHEDIVDGLYLQLKNGGIDSTGGWAIEDEEQGCHKNHSMAQAAVMGDRRDPTWESGERSRDVTVTQTLSWLIVLWAHFLVYPKHGMLYIQCIVYCLNIYDIFEQVQTPVKISCKSNALNLQLRWGLFFTHWVKRPQIECAIQHDKWSN